MKRSDKIKIADNVLSKLQSNSVVLVYKRSAMTAPEMQSLRSSMTSESDSALKVVKNRVLSKSIDKGASDKSNFKKLRQHLKGDTLLIMSNDVAKTATALSNFYAKNKMQYVAGIVDNCECAPETFQVFSKFNSSASLQLGAASLALSQVNLIVNIFKIRSEGEQDMVVSTDKVNEVLSKNTKISESMRSLIHDIMNATVIECAHTYQVLSNMLNALIDSNSCSIDEAFSKHTDISDHLKSIINNILNFTVIQCVQLCQILSEILGIKASLMSAGGAAQAEAVAQEIEDPTAPTMLTITDTTGMNKLQAVKVLRAVFTEWSAKEALDKLNAGGDLMAVPKSTADKLLTDLISHQVVTVIKK